MKKLLIIIATLLLSVQLHAQDTLLLQRIKEANMRTSSFESDLSRHLVSSEKTLNLKGRIVFISPDKLSASFDNDTYLIISGNRMKVDIGFFHGTFRIRKKGLMKSFANLFLYAFQGHCQDLADENNFYIDTQVDEHFNTVILTTKKKSFFGIGYKKAIFHFGLDDLLIKELILNDYGNSLDTYRISNPIFNEQLDTSVFDL